MEFLNDLNEAQRQAVMNIDGPTMVIAGAGSGKTRVLTYRLAFILSQGIADPHELLALTFTNKAAKEMKHRIQGLIGPEAKSLQMGTFHSIFSRILRVEAQKIGYTSAFTIYDTDDSRKLIKTLVKEKRLDDKAYKPQVIGSIISGAKNRMISPKQLKEQVIDDFNKVAAEIYEQYVMRCFKANAMDFDDLLIKPIQLFRSQPDILLKYQHRYRYIMVDEYQDTNHAQYTLIKMLAAVYENICVVGDDAQSIYAFRGADIENILNFQHDYPDMKLFKLEQNYRSTQNIVNAANSIISHNKGQIKKKVFTQNEDGNRIKVIEAITEQDEAKKVSDMIREQKQFYSFFNRDMAILYRTNAQSRTIEEALRKLNIKYRIIGGLSFYQRKEIKDLVAYLRYSVNPTDEEAFRRIINLPKRGIGATSMDKLIVFADQNQLSLWQSLERVSDTGLGARVRNQIKDFVNMINSFGVIAKNNDAYESANYVAKHSGLLKTLHSENTVEGLTRWENVQELLNAAQEFAQDPDLDSNDLESFLADISLFTDQDKEDGTMDAVTLMTVHSAKGLEFKSVFIVGMEENLFPGTLAQETRKDLEEERRLFYVATTRAEKLLTLCYAKSRYRYGNLQYNEPSRFLDEIDKQFLEMPQRPTLRRSDTQGPNTRRTAAPNRGNSRLRVSNSANFSADPPEKIVAGISVMHQKFGKGKVIRVEGQDADRKATVKFEQKGQRVLLLKYAKLKII